MSLAVSKLIYSNEDKGYEYRLTVSEFRGLEYLNIRKYFQSYEGDFLPSTEGASIPLTLENAIAVLEGLMEVVSKSEFDEAMKAYVNFNLIKQP